MSQTIFDRKFIIGSIALVLLVAVFAFFLYGLEPANANGGSSTTVFEIKPGEGFRQVMGGLNTAGLLKSKFTTEVFSILDGSAFRMQAGLYKLNPSMSAREILGELSSVNGAEVTVTIPEGANIYQIDKILSDALVIHSGDLVNFHGDGDLEGKLFPDTYDFFVDSNIQTVVQKFLDDFNAKAAPLLNKDPANFEANLIMASIVEKEVPSSTDQSIVAGILTKRIAAGIPIDVDATVCYGMQVAATTTLPVSCTPLDLKLNSPYNTYLYKGLPPSPIGNPGISAISAVLSPESSAYWFYLSDPKTGKTIFAKTLDEQNQNTIKYLDN